MEAASHLIRHQFVPLKADEPLPTEPGKYLVEIGGSMIAWLQPSNHQRFTLVGTHTDSPNLRVKSKPDRTSAGIHQVTMETYGGLLMNSWLNRDLGLAGRVAMASDAGGGRTENRLVNIDEPMLTIPQLAIHLDREISANGLKLNPQEQLIPIWYGHGESEPTGPDEANNPSGADTAGRFRRYLADVLEVAPDSILSWDLMAYDLQPPGFIGRHNEFIASARIDNLLSSFCGLDALLAVADDVDSADDLGTTPVLVLYDHEEIGSASATGASGSMLISMLERIAGSSGADRQEFLTSLNRSIAVSADGAHATHPNYKDRHDDQHNIGLNQGVVIKRNANQRYATDAVSEAFMVECCRRADVPVQYYIHRSDLRCGSTIGPITAARLGIPTVDAGAPQLSMHSIRETAGTIDAIYLSEVLQSAWTAFAER